MSQKLVHSPEVWETHTSAVTALDDSDQGLVPQHPTSQVSALTTQLDYGVFWGGNPLSLKNVQRSQFHPSAEQGNVLYSKHFHRMGKPLPAQGLVMNTLLQQNHSLVVPCRQCSSNCAQWDPICRFLNPVPT